MKWVPLAIAMVVIFVMLAFGMSLISTGQQELSNETKLSEGYTETVTSVDIMMVALEGVPWALGILAAIAVFYFLFKKAF